MPLASIAVPLIVCVFGLLVYALASGKPRREVVAELGRIAYACGLLICVYVAARHFVKF